MSSSAYAPAVEHTQDSVVKRQYKPKRDWAKWGLATYFVIFLIFLYAPMILMAILSFQGYQGGVTFPFSGPAGLDWWRSIFIFVLTMGEYGTVEVISQGAVTTVGVYVHSQIVGTQYPQGAASAVLLVFVLILGVFAITRFANLRDEI